MYLYNVVAIMILIYNIIIFIIYICLVCYEGERDDVGHSTVSDVSTRCHVSAMEKRQRHKTAILVFHVAVHVFPAARDRSGQVGQLVVAIYQLWDWQGKLYILPYQYFLTAHCKSTA